MRGLKDGVLLTRMEGEAIILDTNYGRYFAVNGSAAMMIESMQDSADEREVVSRITTLMDVDADTAQADFKDLLKSLNEMGLLK